MTNRRKHSPTTLATAFRIAATLLAAACSDVPDPNVPIPVARVDVVAPAPTVRVGETLKLRAEPRDPQGSLLRDRAIAWMSSDESVATVSQAGDVLALSVGTVRITARAEGRSGSTTLSVSPSPDSTSPDPRPHRLSIGRGPEYTVDGNRTEQLYANLFTADNHVVAIFPHSPAGHEIRWTSSDSSVVQVSPTGEITTGWAGSATITAISGALQAETRIHVRSVVRSVKITSYPYASRLAVGETFPITVSASPETRAPTPRPVSWSSSNTRVATVDAGGRVTAHKPGTAIISANVEGIKARATLWVSGDIEHPLQSVGGFSLPTLLYTTVETDDEDRTRTYSAIATGGSFRYSNDPDVAEPTYSLRLNVRIEEEGRTVRTTEYVDEGRVVYTWMGERVFESTTKPGYRFRIEELLDGNNGWRTGEVEMLYDLPGGVRTYLRFGKP